MPDDAALPAVKPPMPDVMRPLALDAKQRHRRRTAVPDVLPEEGPNRLEWGRLTCPYREEDEDLWLALILECFGTRTIAVGGAFMEQLTALCPEVFYVGEERQRTDENMLRQALAIVYSLKPRNEAEAAHAAQLAAIHFATMKVGENIARHGRWSDTRTLATLGALVKVFGAGLETAQKLKGGAKTARQTIKVEKHVHYHDERHVHAPPGGEGNSGSRADGRSELRARATPVLPRPNEGRDALQIAPGEGPEAVPVPWRGQGERRAEG